MAKVSDLLESINKQYKRPLASMGALRVGCGRVPTGIFQFDLATGGGFCRGRINLVYGPESSMKTTLCLKAIAHLQKSDPDKTAVFFDVEGEFDPKWARVHGVDTDKLAYIVPTSSEELIDMVETLMYADDISCVCIDSLAAMVSTGELESSAEKAVVGNAGLAINKLYRKVTRAKNVAIEQGREVTVFLINQTRMKIGVMYGDPETMPGGPAFKFASSLTVRVYGTDEFDKNLNADRPAYKKISLIIKKWKVPVVARNSELHIALMPIPEFGLAVGQSYDWNTVLAYLKKLDMLQKAKGGWDLIDLESGEVIHTYPTQDALKQKMYDDKEFANIVKNKIIEAVTALEDLVDPQ